MDYEIWIMKPTVKSVGNVIDIMNISYSKFYYWNNISTTSTVKVETPSYFQKEMNVKNKEC